MNKEKALGRLSALENEAKELRKIIYAPEKTTAEEWLLDYLSKPFEVKLTKGYITYYRDNQWIFQQDLKNGYLWCYYYKVWQVFEKEYAIKYVEIQELHKKVVGEALNCKELTPRAKVGVPLVWVGEALNCKELTPFSFWFFIEWKVGEALNCKELTPDNKK